MTSLYEVCDDCLNVAYDAGFQGEAQAHMMREMGADVEDHLCIKHEGEGDKCGCPC